MFLIGWITASKRDGMWAKLKESRFRMGFHRFRFEFV